MRNFLTLSLSILISLSAFAQQEIDWQTLSDVTFTDEYNESEGGYYLFPNFGDKVKALEGQEVILKGFILAIDPETGYYLLSSNPYASCFFCGNAGPETVVELEFKPIPKRIKMDQFTRIKGRLKLNDSNIYQCNYIFEEAEIFELKE